jgi:FtsH-binding integral membrane protein
MDYFKQIMQDSTGSPSSKRWITVLFALALCGAFITSIVMSTKADPEIVHAVMYVIITGLGMSGAEKFAPK